MLPVRQSGCPAEPASERAGLRTSAPGGAGGPVTSHPQQPDEQGRGANTNQRNYCAMCFCGFIYGYESEARGHQCVVAGMHARGLRGGAQLGMRIFFMYPTQPPVQNRSPSASAVAQCTTGRVRAVASAHASVLRQWRAVLKSGACLLVRWKLRAPASRLSGGWRRKYDVRQAIRLACTFRHRPSPVTSTPL